MRNLPIHIYGYNNVNAAYLRCQVTDVHVKGENWLFY